MASVRVVLAMYYDKDIEQILRREVKLPFQWNRFDRDRYQLWKQIEMIAIEKLPFLPDTLKIRLSKCIRPIHMETWRWIRDHDRLMKLSFSNCYLTYKNILCWKTNGTIDRIKTAKKIVRDKNVDTRTRFEVACTYFLEDEVLALWHGDKEVKVMGIPRSGTNEAVRFWMTHLKKGSWRKKSWKSMINGYFETPRIRRSDIRLRISSFFPYLSWEGKKNYFPYLDWEYAHHDDLQLCMQTMDKTECAELCHAYPARILFYCLEWPFQSLFMEMANQLLSHMDAYQFHAVLDHIILWHILKGVEYFDYLTLFKEFWCLIPDSFKDEIKRMKKYFKVVEVALNYDKENTSLSLPETIEKLLHKIRN
ncbi:hypothetical protein AVEN_162929-1 [Araneus ventricosus]|uniref:Uncharacterized protein n=1 Tax=Araneus ventricosus TaxID=182803 RepID=A0A4Y2BZZ2_ARAVE|nr:hypothetical protein AVEN_162929-1 [Araneus ventricosus]